MTLYEGFTWFNVAVLVVGSIAVFAVFMRQLPRIVQRRERVDEKREDPEPQSLDGRPGSE